MAKSISVGDVGYLLNGLQLIGGNTLYAAIDH